MEISRHFGQEPFWYYKQSPQHKAKLLQWYRIFISQEWNQPTKEEKEQEKQGMYHAIAAMAKEPSRKQRAKQKEAEAKKIQEDANIRAQKKRERIARQNQ